MPPHLIDKIDEGLAEIGQSRRWLSREIGRGPDYIRDIARGKSKQPKGDDLVQIAARLHKPIDYFMGSRDDARSSPPLTNDMPVNPRIVSRAEQIADMVTTRLVQRRGIADITHEVRGRVVAAAMDALLEAERINQTVPDAMIPVLVVMIQSLIG